MRVNFFLRDFQSDNIMESFSKACAALKGKPGSTLVIEPGEYILSTARSVECMNKTLSGEYGDNPEKKMFSPDFIYSTGLSLTGLKT